MNEYIGPTADMFVTISFCKYTPFSSQGVIDLVLDCIDHVHQYSSASHFAEAAQSETGEEWETILNCLYELLGEN